MVAVGVIEENRLDVQRELDAARTQAERNKLGQFATPTLLARDILNYAKTLLPRHQKIRFLDPAFGTGSFYSALLHSFPSSRISAADGYEIDEGYGQEASRLWSHTPLKLHLEDFTKATPQKSDRQKANLLICNPPYVRHHHLLSEEKVRLQALARETTGVRLSGLAGFYCYFLCLSEAWLVRNGLAGWLIPSEFMDVNYGQEVKKYLLNRVSLVRVHRFDPDEVQFNDALVSSAVLWFRKAQPEPHHKVEFTYGGTLAKPRVSKLIPSRLLRNTPKWTRFPMASTISRLNGRPIKMGDLFEVKRGIATGANGFFIITQQQVAEKQLPKECLKPILPSPRHLPADEVMADADGSPLLKQKLFVLTCNLPEHEVRTRFPALRAYLQVGIKAGIKERYLCKYREPWYAQEERTAARLLCTYMGRQGTNGKPFRFILNHSKAIVANVYLLLYPKPKLQRILDEEPGLLRKLWQALSNVPTKMLIAEGRVYGGGLYKLEPKELANLPLDRVLESF